MVSQAEIQELDYVFSLIVWLKTSFFTEKYVVIAYAEVNNPYFLKYFFFHFVLPYDNYML